MTPAALLRAARRASGMTQTDLARRLGTSQPEIARLESSTGNPTVATLEAAIAATGHELEFSIEPDRSGIDEAQIVANLKLTPAQRLERLTAAHRNLRDLTENARFRT